MYTVGYIPIMHQHRKIMCHKLGWPDGWIFFFLPFEHVPLGVRSTICRHQSPQRAVLGQVDFFVQCELAVGSQSSLDGVQPRDMRTPWWSFQFSDRDKQQQPFYGPLSTTTRVSRYQKKHSPTHHPDHPIFISFFHLPRSIASCLFKLRAWQSFCTTSLHVLFGLPLGLEPSTSYSIHFFTQSVSSFRNTCPDGEAIRIILASALDV